jgi:hypothetical protein
MSSIFIPLTFIAGVYGMNFDFERGTKAAEHARAASPLGYVICVLLMLTIAIGQLIFFRRKTGFEPALTHPGNGRAPPLRSNRLETLATALAGIVRTRSRPVFAPRRSSCKASACGAGSRWSSPRSAASPCIARFLFPQEIVQQLFTAILPRARPIPLSAASCSRGGFCGCSLKRRKGPRARTRELRAGELSELKAFQLSGKIAAVFDRYLAYRPELILQWQQGRELPETLRGRPASGASSAVNAKPRIRRTSPRTARSAP